MTATFASWIVERVQEAGEDTEAATRRDVRALASEVAALRAELVRRPDGRAATQVGPGR